MNRYPAWKYVLIGIALLVGIIYTAPNFYGVVPAVAVSGVRAANKVDEPMKATLDAALKAANVPVLSSELDANGSAHYRFADTDRQIQGRDAIVAKLGQGFVAALNLESNSPPWLHALGAKPMYLGLDLRGGVHFLLQVDMKKAADKSIERYMGDIRTTLRDKKIYYSGLTRESDRITVRFREREQKAAALKLVTDTLVELNVRETESADESQLILTIKPEIVKRDQELALQQNIQTLRNRVNELGVAEPIVQQQGPDRILVQLAGVQDPARAEEILGRTATLEVRMVSEENAAGPGQDAFYAYKDQPAPFATDKFFDQDGQPVLVRKIVVMTGDRIKDAQPGFDEHGRSAVNIKTDETGGRILRQTTRENVKKRMAMLLVEKNKTVVLTWPVIQEEFGSSFRVTGMPDTTEAKNLALLLRAGALAAPMEIIEKSTVGPSLGADNIEKGYHAVLYGFIAIGVFMILYYALFGVVSVAALAANLLFLVGLLSMLQFTLTLPGIAAIALTLGMAIDANVLINERVREEVRSGMTPQMAIQAGYERAFDTILDSNITTLIAGLALLAFGSGPVRGFAVVHCLGILTSIFSAVMVSRGLVNIIYGGRKKVTRLSIGNTTWDKEEDKKNDEDRKKKVAV
ncbi:Protein translocase subunit SecD [Usitatibacter rugosus]|uniref:Protein translocase subunit SecD n=1 Tax=Usitatibacter rugosus TaxID=2732067 RepID=A0A6M4H0F7_9PROT|nr:protein translocase subunit SecD [Usitatibacter rugosus]QJR12164.1 Protein translocase subunit SecD [Usitatibacter rugosus]